MPGETSLVLCDLNLTRLEGISFTNFQEVEWSRGEPCLGGQSRSTSRGGSGISTEHLGVPVSTEGPVWEVATGPSVVEEVGCHGNPGEGVAFPMGDRG